MTGGPAMSSEVPDPRTIMIRNQRGLHARAAAKFVKVVGQHEARVLVFRNGMEVGGDSIMGLMMLAAGPGSTVRLRASGPEAASVLDALQALIERKFDEE